MDPRVFPVIDLKYENFVNQKGHSNVNVTTAFRYGKFFFNRRVVFYNNEYFFEKEFYRILFSRKRYIKKEEDYTYSEAPLTESEKNMYKMGYYVKRNLSRLGRKSLPSLRSLPENPFVEWAIYEDSQPSPTDIKPQLLQLLQPQPQPPQLQPQPQQQLQPPQLQPYQPRPRPPSSEYMFYKQNQWIEVDITKIAKAELILSEGLNHKKSYCNKRLIFYTENFYIIEKNFFHDYISRKRFLNSLTAEETPFLAPSSVFVKDPSTIRYLPRLDLIKKKTHFKKTPPRRLLPAFPPPEWERYADKKPEINKPASVAAFTSNLQSFPFNAGPYITSPIYPQHLSFGIDSAIPTTTLVSSPSISIVTNPKRKLKEILPPTPTPLEDVSVEKEEEKHSLKKRTPHAGIAHKYLPMPNTQLPFNRKRKKAGPDLLPAIAFRQLNTFKEEKSQRVKTDICITNDEKTLAIQFSFLSITPFITKNDRCSFIMLGRGLDGFVPPKTSTDTRIILVVTQEQAASLQDKISKDYDLLVIEKLASPTHGEFDKLGLLTARRLAALIFAHYCGMTTCLMLDDNIQSLHYKSTDPTSINYDTLFDAMEKELSTSTGNSLSVSIKTTSHKPLKTLNKEGALGCKAFMLHMVFITTILQKPEDIFILFPPAQCAAWWGEDYYLQIILEIIGLDTLNQYGYRVLDEKDYALKRSQTHKNICAAVVDKVSVITEIDLESIVQKLDSKKLNYIKKTQERLRKIIEKNIEIRRALEEKFQEKDLVLEHAKTMGITDLRLPDEKSFSDFSLTQETCIPEFKQAIRKHLPALEEVLYPHQIHALKALMDSSKTMGTVNLATGTGKTLLQMALAHIFCQIGFKKYIYIVIPTQNLIKQFHQEFIKYITLMQNKRCDLNILLPTQIIKISNEEENFKQRNLSHPSLKNRGNLIFLICANSFIKVLKENPDILDPGIVLLDESHKLSNSSVDRIIKFCHEKDFMTYAFSATPKVHTDLPEIYRYSCQEGIDEGILPPVLVENFTSSGLDDALDAFILQLPTILKQHLHPSGLTLDKLKGISYFKPGTDFPSIADALKKAGITAFIIHSKYDDHAEQITLFKACNGPCIALACDMLEVGFSDNNINFILIAKSESHDKFMQQAGRVMRLQKNNVCKVGYVASLYEVKHDFETPPMAFLHKEFRAKQKKQLNLADVHRYEDMPMAAFSKPTTLDSMTKTSPSYTSRPPVTTFFEEKLGHALLQRIQGLLNKLTILETEYAKILNPSLDKTSAFFKSATLQPSSPHDSLSKKEKADLWRWKIKLCKDELRELGLTDEELYLKGTDLPGKGVQYSSGFYKPDVL